MQNEAERLYEAKDGAEIMSSKHDMTIALMYWQQLYLLALAHNSQL